MSMGFMQCLPPTLLGIGALLTVGADRQKDLPLRAELEEAIPSSLAQMVGRDQQISEGELRIVGVTDYLFRVYSPPGTAEQAGFTLYVGYYASQTRGHTIHSPKNCLPGAGWEALVATRVAIPGPAGPVTVNRYLLQRGAERALVLYWYQGRGRVESNEYTVKWDLLRDSALRGRSDESLVRILVPITTSEDEAFELASRVAAPIMSGVDRALPL